MEQVARVFINNEIKSLIKNNIYSNVDDFYQKNNNIKEFITNHCNSSIAAHFNLSITNNEYNDIIGSIKDTYIPTFNQTNNNSLNKIKQKININTINGFVDALILAFISGGLISLAFLIIYSKIASNF